MSLLSRLAVQAARAYGALSSNPNAVSADYLVVAGGGGGGGSTAGGGGGAGGYRTSTATLSSLNTYSVTVGAGGNGGANSSSGIGSNGSDSILSGTGLTTITSTGGGGGGNGNNNSGNSGGSGGGGGGKDPGAGGTNAGGSGNTPSTSPSQGNNGGNGAVAYWYSGGGGGGASAVGGVGTGGAIGAGSGSSVAGNGGNGTSSSISGSSVTYAGGGGGGAFGTAGTGGSGGGGNGTTGTNGANGSTNTGGGGGGAGGSGGTGGTGGSGIVIISYTSATPKFVGGTITTSGGKQIHTFTSSGTLSPITPITASYLVVAGGGSGGSGAAGGGGAGGLLTSSTTLYSGATYVVTVGAGGAGISTNTTRGNNGSNSSLSGTGLTTITSIGGGGGTGQSTSGNGQDGGSGGGGSRNNLSGGTGTAGQGNNGGSGTNSANYGGGGGGGAGAAGSNGTTTNGGNGGIGVQSSISGTATYYAGGGGGGMGLSGTPGTGGLGGGTNGSVDPNGTANATPNTGGGSGGAGSSAAVYNSGNGGSGIVIISYAGSQAFNGGLVTSSGGNTIHTFTSTGALTPLTNNLNNSLRFRRSASAYLNRTLGTPTNNKIWTYSAWVKRGALGTGTSQTLLGYGVSGTLDSIGFNSSEQLYYFSVDSGGVTQRANYNTSAVFRDPSAWYHIVVAVDTTQATAGNRFKLYVNGNQQTVTTTTALTQNWNTYINSALSHGIGWQFDGTTNYFDGYMTDINFIDGQALEPYYFGNNDANGVWKPILYKGTYGTNGFYLNFSNTTSTTTLGYDSSPNGNNWTCNNISLTAGTTYDAMTDVPTNTSATVANYCVLSPLDFKSVAPQQANSYVPATDYAFVRGTFWASTGKWYYEWTSSAGGGLPPYVGVAAANITSYLGVTTSGISWYGHSDAYIKPFTATASVAATALTAGDIIGVAFDCDAGTIRYYKNNTLVYTDSTLTVGTLVSPVLLSTFGGGAWNNATFNFGQRPFSYTPPTGYVALNTYNLPTPTILQGNKYMDATLWTGNGAGQTVVNQSQFKPDFLWIKSRSNTYSNVLNDSVRGVTKYLFSDLTSAESTVTDAVTSFNSNGFTLNTNVAVNGSTYTYVGWQWQAGQGSTSSNTSGSITSTVSVNASAGFSVVTWTANGVNGATVGHGLGVAPKFMIVKCRSNTQSWPVYHTTLGNTKYLMLNTTAAEATNIGMWNNTSPTSTVFTTGDSGFLWGTNFTYVAYCWAEIAGFSKFGSYTGNGSADGPFVYLGFRPKWIMIKITSGAVDDWIIFDTSRNTYNLMNLSLFPDTSGAEFTSTTAVVDYLSNGFKIRGTNGIMNGNTYSYIYAAFAENPFKNANAR